MRASSYWRDRPDVAESTDLATAVRRAAVDLPTNQVHKLADAVSHHDAPTALVRHAAANAVPTTLFRQHVTGICDAWARADPAVSGDAVGFALRAAGGAAGDVRGLTDVSVVWTGPASSAVPVRATSAVLTHIIEEARRHLLVVSFAAYNVTTIVDALREATTRGVTVRLVLESTAESKGKLTHDAKAAFDTLAGTASFYVWPAEHRVTASGGHAAMHAKCAVADHATALVTSANLTGAAMTTNMELGLLVRGGDIPRRIRSHYDELIASGTLSKLV